MKSYILVMLDGSEITVPSTPDNDAAITNGKDASTFKNSSVRQGTGRTKSGVTVYIDFTKVCYVMEEDNSVIDAIE